MPSEEERMAMGLRGPGKSLSPEKAEAIRAMGGKLRAMQEAKGDGGCHKSHAPLAVKVNNLIEQRDELCRLCAEMLATFSLPENQDAVAALGVQFPDILARWKRRFEKNSGEA